MTAGPRAPGARICPVCGRRFGWRKRWQRNWDEVVYCSAACRRQRGSRELIRIEEQILTLLSQRRPGSICPSEVARVLRPDASWREMMEPVRRAARRLAQRGELVITQKGQAVDPATARGPVRLRLPPGAGTPPPQ